MLGRVKSRLALGVGPAAACEIYQRMLEALLARLAALPPSIAVELWSADAQRLDLLEGLVAGRHPVRVQGPGDLGRRMEQALHESLAAGAPGAAVLGSDSPDLPLASIEAAFRALETHDMVLGPTDDGGYYLVGLSRPVSGIFEAVPWSSGLELEATRRNARTAALSLAEVPGWYDIDHIEDLERFAARHASAADPALEPLLDEARRRLRQAWAAET